MKSYGRAPTFLMLTGYEQVRSVAAGLAGDWEAARRVELELPETGVCSLQFEEQEQSSSCCAPQHRRRPVLWYARVSRCSCGPEIDLLHTNESLIRTRFPSTLRRRALDQSRRSEAGI